MSVEEIKQTKLGLINWIEQLSDNHMLSFPEGLKESKTDSDWWDHLSDNEIKGISEGLSDAENGRVISSENFWKKLKDA